MPFRLARAGVAGVALAAILLAAISGRGLSQAAFAQSPGTGTDPAAKPRTGPARRRDDPRGASRA